MKAGELLNVVARFIGILTVREKVDARDLFVALRSSELAIAEVIENKFGPVELARLQGIAFEVSLSIHPVEVPADNAKPL